LNDLITPFCFVLILCIPVSQWLSFKGSGPNSRSSQIFIAYGPNKGLGRELWETPVGRVISGMEHAAKFYSYGDMPPWGKGPLQNKIHKGREYIDTEFPLTDSFDTCTVKRSQEGVDNSRAAEVQAAVADAAMEAKLAEAELAAAHGGINAEQDEHAQFQRAEQQLGDGVSTGGTPISLSGMKQAADKMRHFHRDGNGDWSEAALFLACIVLGCAVAGWITTKLFGHSKNKANKSS
jgi:cyclophilin family peptidyl-prolyl cis-trans isomerase